MTKGTPLFSPEIREHAVRMVSTQVGRSKDSMACPRADVRTRTRSLIRDISSQHDPICTQGMFGRWPDIEDRRALLRGFAGCKTGAVVKRAGTQGE